GHGGGHPERAPGRGDHDGPRRHHGPRPSDRPAPDRPVAIRRHAVGAAVPKSRSTRRGTWSARPPAVHRSGVSANGSRRRQYTMARSSRISTPNSKTEEAWSRNLI